MGLLSDMSIKKKVVFGFGGMAALIGIIVAITTVRVTSVQAIDDRVIELRQPTVLASTEMINGINYSLAGLRGYMILGKDKFKQDRAEAWRQLRATEAKLDELSQTWTNPENIRRLEEIKRRLNTFEAAQKEVEGISWTDENTPATHILLTQAAPRAAIMVQNITRMIDLEANLPATRERKALLGMMADVRGTTGLSLANIRAFLLTGDPKFKEQFDGFWAKNERRFADLSGQARLFTPAQRDAFNKLREARNGFKDLPPQMFQIRGGNEWNLANLWLGTKAAPEAGRILTLLHDMVEDQHGLAATDIKAAHQAGTSLITFLVALGIIGVGIAVMVATAISTAINRPLTLATQGMQAVARGDLTQRVEVNSNDELGRMMADMNKMSESLEDIVTNVRNTAEFISGGSVELAQGNADLSQRTEEQAAALEETASSMEEMTSNVKQSADNAVKANELAVGARDQARKGGDVVQKAVTAMGEINESSQKIAEIIGMINEIAFQTNLLALNAAVEAARAGEQGRGFAVVASEVRNLAQRSGNAADEIKRLIEDSVAKVANGSGLVEETGKALSEIQDSITRVTDIVSEMNAASQEQSTGIEQVNRAVMQMDEVVQQNAALVEEGAATSDNLAEEAQKLAEMMSFFTTSQVAMSPRRVQRNSSLGTGTGGSSFVSKPRRRKKAAQPVVAGTSAETAETSSDSEESRNSTDRMEDF